MNYSDNIIPLKDTRAAILVLRHNDALLMDPGPLIQLCGALGQAQAEEAVLVHLEELVRCLHQVEVAYRSCSFETLAEAAGNIQHRATALGLNGLANVSDDVLLVLASQDSAALAAVVARLGRIGDRSVCEIWDMETTLH